MPTFEAGVARERSREVLFGAAERQSEIRRYRVLERVGAGAMGVVYAAYDPDLDRRIALKILRSPDVAPSSQAKERMLAEARALARLSHPNVVTVFEVGVWGEADEAVFVAMEFVQGRTLRAWQEQSQPDWRAIVATYVQAGRGLSAVHRAGLVHRDFKPDNAMIDDEGRVRVMDFGLARTEVDAQTSMLAATVSSQDDIKLTGTGTLVGTPAYMAPEQWAGLPADAYSDQWALCVSLYEALWGGRPYRGDNPVSLAASVLADERPPEPADPAGVPKRIRDAILRGLSRTPDARWPSLDALVDALDVSRRGRSRVIGIAVVGAVGVGAVGIVANRGPAPCQGSAAAFADAWNEGKALRVRTAFMATAVGWAEQSADETLRNLETYATRWVTEHHDACEAARVEHTQSDAMFDRRVQCLARGRRAFVALVDALAAVDTEGLLLAHAATRRLSPPARCGDSAFLDATNETPPPVEVADAVDDLRTNLADVAASIELGGAEQALLRTEGVVEAATKTLYPPVVAQAHLVVGEVQLQLDHVEPALEHLEAAYYGARTIEDRATAAQAALQLASLTGTHMGEYPLARQWLRLADVELDPEALEDRAALASLEVSVLEREGHLDDAVAAAERMLARAQAECDEACEAQSDAHEELSRLYDQLAREREAEQHARAAVQLEASLHAGDHPHHARAQTLLGEVLDSAGRFSESHAALDTALRMREKMLGVDHPETAMTRVRFATTLLALDRGDEAVMEAQRAVRATRGAHDPLLLAAALNELGGILSDLRRSESARDAYEESTAIQREVHPDGDPNLAIGILNLARVARQLGDLPGALAGFEEALAMRRKHVLGHDPLQSSFLINIGRTQLDLGHNDEGIARLREAVALAANEEIWHPIVTAQVWLWKAVRATDPTEAAGVLAEARTRCEAAPPAARAAAACERLDGLDGNATAAP